MARTCTIITDEALQLPSQGQLRTALALSEEGQLPSVVSEGLWLAILCLQDMIQTCET